LPAGSRFTDVAQSHPALLLACWVMDRPDLAWKLVLQRRLPAVLALLFPEIHALADWSQEYSLPDKNLLPATADGRVGEREPDFVAIVSLKDGSQVCVNVEVQCTRQKGFAERMELYHARLRDRFDMPVFSLAILGDSSPSWRPHSISTLREGCGTTFQFLFAKLIDFRDRQDDLLRASDPVALALAAHVIALDTRHRPALRLRAKLRLSRPLHERRCNLKELNERQKIIDWMLPLPAELQRRLVMDIDEFMLEHEKEDKNSLNYLIPERILQRHKEQAAAEGRATGIAEGIAEGRTKGRVEGRVEGRIEGRTEGRATGQRQTLNLQLEVRFGRMPAHLQRTLDRASPSQLERLAIALLDADSLEGALRAAGLRLGRRGFGPDGMQDADQETQPGSEPDD
jgi:hypothetical protein